MFRYNSEYVAIKYINVPIIIHCVHSNTNSVPIIPVLITVIIQSTILQYICSNIDSNILMMTITPIVKRNSLRNTNTNERSKVPQIASSLAKLNCTELKRALVSLRSYTQLPCSRFKHQQFFSLQTVCIPNKDIQIQTL